MSTSHILLVDDDLRLLELLKRYLQQHNYWISTATRISEAEHALSVFRFDVMLLDVMLPEENGWSFLSRNTLVLPPVIFLSAMGGPEERVKGLSLGAKDYIMKPFEPTELLLRLKNLIPAEYILDLGDRYFNVRNGQLYDQTHQMVPMTELEGKIMLYMTKHLNQRVPRETLMALFFSTASNIRVVDVTLSRLRKKLDPENTSPQMLSAVRNQGYIFQAHSKRMI